MTTPSTAIVLYSGGLDSTTCLAIAQSKGFHIQALSVDYGQRHASELIAAQRICQQMGIEQHIIKLPKINSIQESSTLTNAAQPVPDHQPESALPSTYVPARNLRFLSYATALADVIDAQDIFIGVSAIDYSGYPDCRPEFIQAFEKTANLGSRYADSDSKIRIHAPLIQLSKAQTVQLGTQLGVDYAQTVSCYRATEDGFACGTCDSCVLRKKGFLEANIPDPTLYKR